MGIIPDEAVPSNFMILFDWMFKHIIELRDSDIHVNRIGISVYSKTLEKYVIKYGL